MNTDSLNAANKEKEKNVIEHILRSNKYDVSILNRPTKTGNKKKQSTSKWDILHM